MTRRPMSEARRQHIYGAIKPLAEEARTLGEPSVWLGTIVAGLAVLGIVCACLFLKGILP